MAEPDEAPSFAETVVGAMGPLNLADVDAAAARLAYAYAQAIDITGDPDVLAKLGPKLLDTLDALGMTPKSRAATARGEADDQPSPRARAIAELRARSHARQHHP